MQHYQSFLVAPAFSALFTLHVERFLFPVSLRREELSLLMWQDPTPVHWQLPCCYHAFSSEGRSTVAVIPKRL